MEGPFVNVDLLILKDGSVLLGRWAEKWSDGKEIWGIPGKDLHAGETFAEAASRNLREEFGGALKRCEVIGVNANRSYGKHYVGVVLTAEPEAKLDLTVRSDDWKEWRWFPLSALPDGLFAAAASALMCYQEDKVCAAD